MAFSTGVYDNRVHGVLLNEIFWEFRYFGSNAKHMTRGEARHRDK